MSATHPPINPPENKKFYLNSDDEEKSFLMFLTSF